MPVYVDMILNQEEELPSSWYIYHKLTIPEYKNLLNKEKLNIIMASFQNKQYDSAMIIAFSVIEGLLWEMSYEVSKREKVFVNSVSIMYDCKKKEEFQSTRIRDVIERGVYSHQW